jgi:multicomponent Na+:H+ antiporter subunit D
MIDQNLPVLVPVLFLLAALLAPLLGQWRRGLSYLVALLASLVNTAVALYSLYYVVVNGIVRHKFGGWVPPIGIEYVLDPLAAFMIAVVTVVSLVVLVHSRQVVKVELAGRDVPFYGVVMLLLAGFCGIVVTGDLFNLYVFLEISSLATYALIAAGEKPAPVAAFRYLIMGTIGASFYLFGLWFIYNMTGSLNMADIAAILPGVYGETGVIIGLLLMVVGIGIKMALFPLHGWLPDAYTYASSASTAFIAPIGTKIGAYVLIRILLYVFEPGYFSSQIPLADVIMWLAAAGILYGSVMAIAQKELKRMLAYSSIAQIGYIGLGLGLANPLGLIGAVLHTLNHAFMKACLFLVAGNLRVTIGHSDISRFDAALRRKMPWTMAAFTVGALSMIGIPPTAGFFSKWYLVLGGIDRGAWIMVVVILVSSLLNAVYFFRVLENTYFRPALSMDEAMGDYDHPDADIESFPREEVAPSMLVPTLVLGTGIVLLGIFNAFIVSAVIRLMVPAGL